ncbi:MAG: hypothetical protein ACI8RD_011315, partial [Bacillariaceae sp.]
VVARYYSARWKHGQTRFFLIFFTVGTNIYDPCKKCESTKPKRIKY